MIEEKVLRPLIESGKTLKEIATELNVSYGQVYTYTEKYNIPKKSRGGTTVLSYDESGKVCKECNIKKSLDEFYKGSRAGHPFARCKDCCKKIQKQKLIKAKSLAVNYKGGKCEKCGYSKNLSALDFHHLDPNQKDFEITRTLFTKLSSKITKELDKCILVCSNCHREIHNPDLTF